MILHRLCTVSQGSLGRRLLWKQLLPRGHRYLISWDLSQITAPSASTCPLTHAGDLSGILLDELYFLCVGWILSHMEPREISFIDELLCF